jgi:hypothetical protein
LPITLIDFNEPFTGRSRSRSEQRHIILQIGAL